MILDGKKVLDVLAEYEKDLVETHIKAILSSDSGNITTITAAQIEAVREIGNRLQSPEIKA